MRRFVILGLLLSLLTACDLSSTSKPGDSSAVTASPEAAQSVKQATTAEGTDGKGDATSIQLDDATHAQMLARIEQNKGRVVVVDIWSTSCMPCMKEFPHLVELAARWPDDIVCMSMNVDYIGLPTEPVEKLKPKVVDFLKSKKAGLPNLVNLISSESDTDMLAKLQIESLPAILVYDRAGGLVAKLSVDNAGEDGLTYAGDVLPLVESLVKPK